MAEDGLSIEIDIPFGGAADPTIRLSGPKGDVRDAIGSFFWGDCDTLTNVPLAELVIEASRTARGASQIVHGLGANFVPSQAGTSETVSPASSAERSEVHAVLEQIEACRTIDELKRLWAENQARFSDSAVMGAWKARGRALAASS
ncbi:hypothetical protein [Streptomyces catenulae]|uniref:Uncharacterized protein n=1 Tax=Streptomyces catenulae TaxID=66875 RepID=A0ABV2YTE1_9ACTN|nr:hypothetical protein [Streptomyces catenulae]